MSWHGPSALGGGIATKSLVVASCASKLASTASRIFRLMSLAFIASRFLSSCCKIETPQRVSNDLARIASRIAAAPINFAHGASCPMETPDDRQLQHSVLLQAHGSPRRTRLANKSKRVFLQASFVRRPSLKALSFLILGCCGLFVLLCLRWRNRFHANRTLVNCGSGSASR